MLHISSAKELKSYVDEVKNSGKTVGFVPTLGALHNGHMSLINIASTQCDIIICSIFVNPTQFDDPNDLNKYPRTLENDLELLKKNNCNVCFTPSVAEVYPNGQQLEKEYDIGYLENILEGKTRPGHYQGVAQVVHRLLVMVHPDILFLGQKDFQQVKVLSNMIEEQNLPVKVIMCNIVREEDGLAMSSRNVRLTKEERKVAHQLYKTLKSCKKAYPDIPLEKLQKWGIDNLNNQPLITVDYLTFCNVKNLKEVQSWNEAKSIILLGAISLGKIRLIDNVIIS